MATRNLVMISGTINGPIKAVRDGVIIPFIHQDEKEKGYPTEVRAEVLCFGELGSAVATLKQGTAIYVEGRVSSRLQENVHGKNYVCQIIASDVQTGRLDRVTVKR